MRETGTLRSGVRRTLQPRGSWDARRRNRCKLNLPALLWPFEPKNRHEKEVARVANFTREGLYFITKRRHYFVGMKLLVTFPFSPKAPAMRDYLGVVIRIEALARETFGVALKFVY